MGFNLRESYSKKQKKSFFKLPSRKGQSNMFWIIIGAVIALVVMIVLLLLFTGKTKTLEEGVSGCVGKGGDCFDPGKGCGSDRLEAPFECSPPEYVCCIGFGDDEK